MGLATWIRGHRGAAAWAGVLVLAATACSALSPPARTTPSSTAATTAATTSQAATPGTTGQAATSPVSTQPATSQASTAPGSARVGGPAPSPPGMATAGVVDVTGALTGSLQSVPREPCFFDEGLNTQGRLTAGSTAYSTQLNVIENRGTNQWQVLVRASGTPSSMISYVWHSTTGEGTLQPLANGIALVHVVIPAGAPYGPGPEPAGSITLDGQLRCTPVR